MIENEDWSSGIDLALLFEYRWLSVIGIDPGETTGMYRCLIDMDGVWKGSMGMVGAGSGAGPSGCQVSMVSSDPRFMIQEVNAMSVIMRNITRSWDSQIGSLSSPMASQMVGRIIVCEDFILREKTADRKLLSPVRLTAMLVDHLHSLRQPILFQLQSPSDKSIVTDEILKRMGLWRPGKPHMMDAARHVNLMLRKVK